MRRALSASPPMQGQDLTTTPRAFTPRVIFASRHCHLTEERQGCSKRLTGVPPWCRRRTWPGSSRQVASPHNARSLVHQGEKVDNASLKRRAPSSTSLPARSTAPLGLALLAVGGEGASLISVNAPSLRSSACALTQSAPAFATLAAAHDAVVPEYQPAVQPDADSPDCSTPLGWSTSRR